MLVYRIEDLHGLGPYCGDDEREEPIFMANGRHVETCTRPVPDIHYMQRTGEEFRFACATEKGLLRWFKPFISNLAREHFYMSVYDAPWVRLEKYQVAFAYAHATHLGRTPVARWNLANGIHKSL